MKKRINRRDFLKSSAMAGAGFWVANNYGCSLLGPVPAPRRLGANDKLNVASIGGGGQGGGDCGGLASQGCNIVAICDVDERRAGGSFERFPNAKRFKDFRVMFDQMANEIDAVHVSTPDHTHAVATMMAMKLGIHVYTQKPLTHDVYEARMLTKAASKYKNVVTQMGNQGTSHNGLREAVEVVQAGAIGAVREVHVWTNRPVWPQGIDRPKETKPVPAGLDWDLWLGTAPVRPYHDCYLPFNWRGWVDYGTGALGDMACHTANMAFMACRLGYPTSVEVTDMAPFNRDSFPKWSVIRYDFPERDGLPPLKWTWYDGGNDKPKWVNVKLKELAHGQNIPGSGSLIIGDKGTLYSPNDYGSEYHLLPGEQFESYKKPTPTLPRANGNHYGEFVAACKEGNPDKCMSKFSYAGPLTETVVLGCVAMLAGQRIEWDGPRMKITNDSKANDYLKRDYRKGWSL